MAALSAACVMIAACVLFGYRMSGNVAVFVLSWLLTMIAMFSIGLLVAALCKTAKSMNHFAERQKAICTGSGCLHR